MPQLDPADAVEVGRAEMAAADVGVLEVLASDNGHGPVVGGEITVVPAVIEPVPEEIGRAVVPGQRAPAEIVTVPPPIDPSRAPMGPGDPVPAEAEAPVPTAVVVDGPAPGLGRDPGPADEIVPRPTPVRVGAPIVVIGHVGHPDVAVGLLVDPVPVIIELLFIFRHFGRQVLAVAPGHEQGIPVAVPLVERVGAGRRILGIAEEPAVGSRHGLMGLDDDRARFGCGFEAALRGIGPGRSVGPDVKPVKPGFEHVERGVGSMDLEALVLEEGADPHVDGAFRQVDADTLIALCGQGRELDLGVFAEAQVIALAEVDLGLASLGPERVALDEGQVDLALFKALVRRALDKDVAVDVAQAGITVGIVPLVRDGRGLLGGQAQGDRNDECGRHKRRSDHHLVHRLSPSDPLLSN